MLLTCTLCKVEQDREQFAVETICIRCPKKLYACKACVPDAATGRSALEGAHGCPRC